MAGTRVGQESRACARQKGTGLRMNQAHGREGKSLRFLPPTGKGSVLNQGETEGRAISLVGAPRGKPGSREAIGEGDTVPGEGS